MEALLLISLFLLGVWCVIAFSEHEPQSKAERLEEEHHNLSAGEDAEQTRLLNRIRSMPEGTEQDCLRQEYQDLKAKNDAAKRARMARY